MPDHDEFDPETDGPSRAMKCAEDVAAITQAYVRRAESNAETVMVCSAAAAALIALDVVMTARQLGVAPNADLVTACLVKLSKGATAVLADTARAAAIAQL